MDVLFLLAAAGILISLFFAFTNGYNDAGADVATMVSSGAASVKGALLTASLANFIGALINRRAAHHAKNLEHRPSPKMEFRPL